MAIPVLLGLPWLGSLIGGVFTSLLTFFATVFTKRLAVIALVITLVITATVALFVALESALSSVAVAFPSVQGIGVIIPHNFTECASVVIGARVTHWAYGWHIRFIEYKLSL